MVGISSSFSIVPEPLFGLKLTGYRPVYFRRLNPSDCDEIYAVSWCSFPFAPPMSTAGNTTITLTPALSELPELVAAVELFAEAEALTPPDAMALTLAAEELFTNTANHGGSPEPSTLSLTRNGDIVRFTYTDSGCPFDTATASASADITLSAASRPIGGLGLHMIARTMESFQYERRGQHNITTLVRRLGAKKLAL
jgi:serine/threonine-protein kinase RsbW